MAELWARIVIWWRWRKQRKAYRRAAMETSRENRPDVERWG